MIGDYHQTVIYSKGAISYKFVYGLTFDGKSREAGIMFTHRDYPPVVLKPHTVNPNGLLLRGFVREIENKA